MNHQQRMLVLMVFIPVMLVAFYYYMKCVLAASQRKLFGNKKNYPGTNFGRMYCADDLLKGWDATVRNFDAPQVAPYKHVSKNCESHSVVLAVAYSALLTVSV